jgi:hypothetical protein
MSLKISSRPETSHSGHGTRVYEAILVNTGTAALELSAIQMPGGYVGSGRFFPCSLMLWDVKTQRWKRSQLFSADQFGKSPKLIQVRLDPGQKLSVCTLVLPTQAGELGQQARFLLRRSWKSNSTLLAQSPVFKIGD